MFNFLRNRFIAIAASSNYFGGEERQVVVQQKQHQQRHLLFPPTSGVNKEESVSSSSCSCQQQQNLLMTEITTIDQNLMDETYFLNKFDEYEKNDNDQNRIKLQSASSEHEAYINASPLELPFARRNYILTQGPLPNTTGDFWQMIYEQNVSICIMLSKVMEKSFVKCHSYFPHKDAPKSKFENFECLLEHEEIKPNYIIRRICLTPLDSFCKQNKNLANNYVTPNNSPTKSVGSDGNIGENTTTTNLLQTNFGGCESRVIHHFQFTTWPDFGVPEDTDQFLEFLEEVRRTREMLLTTSQKESISLEDEGSSIQTNPPVVCHCSAGIGRTGTFVIVDSVLSMIEMNRINKQNLMTLENNGAKNDILTLNNKEEGEKQQQILNSLESLVVFIRKHRMGLIQTPQQLRFCWKTIVDWINKQHPKQQFPSSPKSTATSPLARPESDLFANDSVNYSSDNESNASHGISPHDDISFCLTTTLDCANNRRSLNVSTSPRGTLSPRGTVSPRGAVSPRVGALSPGGSLGGALNPEATLNSENGRRSFSPFNCPPQPTSPLSPSLIHGGPTTTQTISSSSPLQPIITTTTTSISPSKNPTDKTSPKNRKESDDCDERMSSTSRGSSSHLSLVLSSSDNCMY
uniref:protein-tyrosine-phosphatase n=1 Tax=Meloidogyne hapla TaxID=6305 RepID=A0A1I8BRW6_MELHA